MPRPASCQLLAGGIYEEVTRPPLYRIRDLYERASFQDAHSPRALTHFDGASQARAQLPQWTARLNASG
jgi:hypothetical protein